MLITLTPILKRVKGVQRHHGWFEYMLLIFVVSGLRISHFETPLFPGPQQPARYLTFGTVSWVKNGV